MKKLIFYSIITIIFLSCEKKKDPDPLPVLKGFETKVFYPNETHKSTYSLIYNNDKLNNLQVTIQSFKKDGSLLNESPIINNVITEEASGEYKKISDVTNIFNGVYIPTNNKVIYTAKRIANGYEIFTTYIDIFNRPTTSYCQIEFNTNNQVTKYINTKIVTTEPNGEKKETLYNSYTRFEYDTRGNVIKRFYYDGNSTEYLSNGYTYDDKPNPYKALKWFYRLSDYRMVESESTNNILTTKTFNPRLEITNVYTYDTQTGYPLSYVSTIKNLSSYNVGFTPESSKTTYKY